MRSAGPDGLRKTLSHSVIYGVGLGAQNIVGLIMLPIYTRFLTPADYGTLGMMQIIIDLVSMIFGAQLSHGVFRNFYAAQTVGEKNSVVASALGFVIAFKLVGVGVLAVLAGPSARLLFGSEDLSGYMALFGVSLLTSSLFIIPFQYLRALERPAAFVALSLLKLIIQVCLNVYFLVQLGMGVLGVIWATVLTGLTLGLSMAAWTLVRTRFSFSLAQARNLMSFSWPLILTGLMSLYISAGARSLISTFSGLADVGLFMLANRLSAVMSSGIVRPFQQAWIPRRFKLVGSDDGMRTYGRGFLLVSVVLVIAGVALATFAPEVLRLMSDRAFWSAAAIVPILVLQNVITAASRFSRFGLLVEGRTKAFLSPMVVSALGATAIGFLLVEPFGAVGIAWALVCQAALNLWLIERKERSAFDVKLPWGRFWILVTTGSLVYVLSTLVEPGTLVAFIYKTCLLAVFVVIVVFSPIVGRQERKALLRLGTDLANSVRRRTRDSRA